MANLPITPHYELSAGSHCLNFLNTVWERRGYTTSTPEEPHELLHSFSEVLNWAHAAELLPTESLKAIARSAAADQRKAQRTYERLIHFRETLFNVVVAFVLGRRITPSLLDELNGHIATLPSLVIEFESPRFVLAEQLPVGDLRHIEALLYRDATQLLVSVDRERLRFCSADDCGWVFLDTSKNNQRRWCSMSTCGNRDKVARFIQRQRKETSSKTKTSVKKDQP